MIASVIKLAPLVLVLSLTGCKDELDTKETTRGDAKSSQGTVESTSLTALPSPVAATPMSLILDVSGQEESLVKLGLPNKASAAYYRALPDNVLMARAEAGEKMAKAFLIERLATDGIILQRSRGADGRMASNIDDTELVADLGRISKELSTLAQDPNNAFVGYLWGMYMSAANYGAPYEPIVAGIRLASLRGDPRAFEYERQFLADHPGLDLNKVDLYFKSGRRELNSNPSLQ